MLSKYRDSFSVSGKTNCKQTSRVFKMKTKNVNNAPEKCDEWLSTRNKKKISKPTPMIKKHSAARNFVKSAFSSKLTQNSPPPPQIFTNTKQSVLMSYFTSKPSSSSEQSFDDLNEFDVDMQEELTEQFGFLSQDECNEKERPQNISLSYSKVIKNNSAKCQVKCDIDASNDDNDDCKMSDEFKFLSKSKKNVVKINNQNHSDESDIEFISQTNAEQNRNSEQKNKLNIQSENLNSKTDTDSDIEFISQFPKKVNPPNSTNKSKTAGQNSVENIRETFSKGHKENKNSKIDTDSDIEFVSQCPKTVVKYVDSQKSTVKSKKAEQNCVENIGKIFENENTNSKTDTDSDIEFVSQCPETVGKYVNSQKSKVKSKMTGHSFLEKKFKDKFQSDSSGDDIEFLSQCPEQKSKRSTAELYTSNQKKPCQSAKILEPDSDFSDIEFYSQIPKNSKSMKTIENIPENDKKLSKQVQKDYENECRHSVDNVELKCNKDFQAPEISSEGSDIEFISQSVLQNPKTFYKFCDSVNSMNHFQNHTLNVTLNTEELHTPLDQDLDSENQEDLSLSDTLHPEEQILVEQRWEQQGREERSLERAEQCLSDQNLVQQSQADSLEEKSAEDSQAEKSPTDNMSFESEDETQADKLASMSTGHQEQRQNKGKNSLRHKSRLLHRFLPDTIKFTDTESDSCEVPPQKTTCTGMYVKSPDSDVFTLQDSQHINLHINRSKKRKNLDVCKPNNLNMS